MKRHKLFHFIRRQKRKAKMRKESRGEEPLDMKKSRNRSTTLES
jgi:hypothetical protein